MISLQSKVSKECSPAPHFESINSPVLSLLYGPTLITIHDSWKNHSFDYMDLCWQSDVSAFYYACWSYSFLFKEQASFNFKAAVIVCSDFGAHENKICHCFHFSPTICLEVMRLDTMILAFSMLSFKPA